MATTQTSTPALDLVSSSDQKTSPKPRHLGKGRAHENVPSVFLDDFDAQEPNHCYNALAMCAEISRQYIRENKNGKDTKYF